MGRIRFGRLNVEKKITQRKMEFEECFKITCVFYDLNIKSRETAGVKMHSKGKAWPEDPVDKNK